MPNFNGKGPQGNGSGTGRGRGRCQGMAGQKQGVGQDTALCSSQTQEGSFGQGLGRGQGMGRGQSMGQGGCGRALRGGRG